LSPSKNEFLEVLDFLGGDSLEKHGVYPKIWEQFLAGPPTPVLSEIVLICSQTLSTMS